MDLRKNKSGFTLLEVIIVLIIIAILVSIALPRFFKTVEKSRSMEALRLIDLLKGSCTRKILVSGDASTCNQDNNWDFPNLDIDNPNAITTRFFNYEIAGEANSNSNFTVYAYRNSKSGGNSASYITLTVDSTSNTLNGFGDYSDL